MTITSGIVQLSWEEKAKRAAAHQSSDQNDSGIAYNEAFEDERFPVETDDTVQSEAEAGLITLSLQLHPEIKAWLAEQAVPAEQLVARLLQDFYRVQQLLAEKD